MNVEQDAGRDEQADLRDRARDHVADAVERTRPVVVTGAERARDHVATGVERGAPVVGEVVERAVVVAARLWRAWEDASAKRRLGAVLVVSYVVFHEVSLLAALGVVVVGVGAHSAVNDPDPVADPVRLAKEKYVAGEIDEQELERRLAIRLDEDKQKVREVVEQVNGVGPSTSSEVALRFETVEALRAASVEELQAVPEVGEARAEAIARRTR